MRVEARSGYIRCVHEHKVRCDTGTRRPLASVHDERAAKTFAWVRRGDGKPAEQHSRDRLIARQLLRARGRDVPERDGGRADRIIARDLPGFVEGNKTFRDPAADILCRLFANVAIKRRS